MKIAIGNDHVAVALKKCIMAFLEEKGIEVINVGTDSIIPFPATRLERWLPRERWIMVS